MGLGSHTLVTWVKNVVTKGTLSVKMKDVVGPYFGGFKGVGQWDPFLPSYLTWRSIACKSSSELHNGMV
jgi:hypothetical protein